MALNTNKDLKMYYSIKEVAELLSVTEPTLRYWETVFPQVKPYKGANGARRYTNDDIKTLRTIYYLVKERGLTLEGAKKQLKHGSLKVYNQVMQFTSSQATTHQSQFQETKVSKIH
jgi:DNA-binding transcriptional MerR regulator